MAADPHQGGTPPPTLTFPTDPSEFDSDERISFSKLDNKFIAVHDDGTEFEYDQQLKRWIPTIDEELVRQQQSAYGGPAADDNDGYNSNNDYENIQNYQRNKKRKKDEDNGLSAEKPSRPSKKQQRQNNNAPKSNTAVYVTGLPLDATADEVHEVFSRKCGVVAEEIDSGRPRIKLYADERGNFKGDALVVFFKPQSVDMAIMLLDDTEFRYTPNGGTGRMRVQAADASYKKTTYDSNNKGDSEGGGAVNKITGIADRIESGGGGNGNSSSNNNNNNGSDAAAAARPAKDRAAREQDKQKIIKRTQKLDAKLADWDDDDPSTLVENQPPQRGGGNGDRVVILRHMFTLEELDEDPAALLEIKEDVRDECSKLGPVTNVVLYDGEPEGIVAVKFRHPEAAAACVRLMDGRAFDGRIVRAAVTDGRERFRRSDKKQDDEEEEGAAAKDGEVATKS